MNLEKLEKIITQSADSIKSNGNTWNFAYKAKLLICIADENANRMRIISLVLTQEKLDKELISNIFLLFTPH